jgi:hypothetical protein
LDHSRKIKGKLFGSSKVRVSELFVPKDFTFQGYILKKLELDSDPYRQ